MKQSESGNKIQILESLLSNNRNSSKLIEYGEEILNLMDIIEINNETKEIKANSFIKAGEDDLKSAKILYNSKIFPNAIYHLQQSVEKFVKGYMIDFIGLTNKEIKNINHDSPKAFIKLIKKMDKILTISLVFAKNYNVLDNQTSDILINNVQNINMFDNLFNKNKGYIAKMDCFEIRRFINTASKINDSFDLSKSNEISERIIEDIKSLKNELIATEISENNKTTMNEAIDVIDTILINFDISKFAESSKLSVLYILSLLTYPHATLARYPNQILPPEKYDENLGIVQCFDEIIEILEKI